MTAEVIPSSGCVVGIFFAILRGREGRKLIALDAGEGRILFRCLIYTHPVEARFVNEVRVGSRSPTSIAYTLIEDEIERLGVGPLSVGEGIAVSALGRASHEFAIYVPRNERGCPLYSESVVAAVVDVATLYGRRGILLVLERESPVRV